MSNIIIRPPWQGTERDVTDESAYRGRREFIKRMGLGSIGLGSIGLAAGTFPGCARASSTDGMDPDGPLDCIPENAPRDGLPATRNANFVVPERKATTHLAAASYNNFYEFISQGDLKKVWPLTGDYQPFPNTIEVDGLVGKKQTFDVADLALEMGLEERLYRFRCVEAWSMTIPWTGFPLRKLIEKCEPLSSATHVRFVSLARRREMPGISAAPWLSFPYYEGLRMDEATNELAFLATGMYGQPLPKQNGSPIRMVLPWKYGYKGAKAITRIEFVDSQPKTYWNDLYPNEYGFLSNINPNIPHPRWSQAQERFISEQDVMEEIPTQLFNGYSEFVGDLYPNEPTTLTRTVR